MSSSHTPPRHGGNSGNSRRSGSRQHPPGTLQKMVQAAAAHQHSVKWSHVLHYLKSHCVVVDSDNSDEQQPQPQPPQPQPLPFESPLQPYYAANEQLRAELQPDLHGHSILRTAMQTAPRSIVAALCQLGPAALRREDTRGRLPLHSACRFAVSPQTDAAMEVVLQAHPAALIHRDHRGRTPLHYLLWYHGPHRSPEIVALFCQNLRPLGVGADAFYRLNNHDHNQQQSQHQPQHQPQQQSQSPGNNHDKYATVVLPDLPDVPKPSQRSKIPCSAAIVPDAIHGCTPLHYAAHFGASAVVLQVLLQVHPAARHMVDRNGRTPLHWYLMNGGTGGESMAELSSDSGAGGSSSRGSSYSRRVMRRQQQSQQTQQQQQQRQQQPRTWDATVVQLLLSSRVARTLDCRERTGLHWACWSLAHRYCRGVNDSNNRNNNNDGDNNNSDSDDGDSAVLLDVVQRLLDTFVGQLFVRDADGRTPCQLLFDTAQQIQQRQWGQEQQQEQHDDSNNGRTATTTDVDDASDIYHQHHRKQRKRKSDAWNLTTGGPAAFAPPLQLLKLLLQQPEGGTQPSVASTEDGWGRLPLHAALEVAAPADAIALLLELHPTALVHTTEETVRVPLHAAFCHEWTAPLQSARVVNLLCDAYRADAVTVDGRLALKMEDATGYYPVHYACHNLAALEVIQALVDRYPQTALLATPHGDLPVHCLLDDEELLEAAVSTMTMVGANIMNTSASSAECERVLTPPPVSVELREQMLVMREKIRALVVPLLSEPAKLSVADSIKGMLPLHVALLFDAVDYRLLLRLLELCPGSASKFTGAVLRGGGGGVDSGCCFSPLDLMELSKVRRKNNNRGNGDADDDDEEWHRMRELLFSFSPRLESHRHRQELLDRCVRLIVDEVVGGAEGAENRYHWNARREKEAGNVPDLELTHTVSNLEATVLPTRITRGPRNSRNRKTRGRLSHNRSGDDDYATEPSSRSPLLAGSSSIYDEEGTHFDYDFSGGGSRSDDDGSASSYGSRTTSDGDDETFTDGYSTTSDTNGSRSDTMGSGTYASGTYASETMGSRSLYTTTSGSRLHTTFEDEEEEGTLQSSADSMTDDGGSPTGGILFGEPSDRSGRVRGPPSLQRHSSASLDLSGSDKHSLGSILDLTKKIRYAGEEKKDEVGDFRGKPKTPQRGNVSKKQRKYQLPPYMSEVAMRLWTFFVLYCDPNNPSDHYVKQVADIIDEMKFTTIEQLVSNPLPPFAEEYLRDGDGIEGRCFRDVASPKCRELILKMCYFLGRYDFRTDEDILVHRSDDGTSVLLQVQEWLFTTEEVTDARNPGVSEENIWATGEVPVEIGVTFRMHRRTVWIKLTKNAMEYNNEVNRRIKLGVPVEENGLPSKQSGIVPILQHYNAFNTERKIDRMYSVDIKDKRFSAVNLLEGEGSVGNEKIILDEYPYAIVYPAPPHGTLYDYFLRHGIRSEAQSKNTITQMAEVLKTMHENGVCHGNFSIRNVVSGSCNRIVGRRQWSLLDLSSSLCFDCFGEERQNLGGVNLQGFAQFKTETLPPEMFVTLNPLELKKYRFYWSSMEMRFGVKIDKSITEPIVDVETGEAFVPKCHFMPLRIEESHDLLPYKLVPASPGTDLWALGQLLFLLLTGRTLTQVFPRDGRLVQYRSVYEWDPAPIIYEHISDPLAQDLLLKLLGSQETREKMTVEAVLRHPYLYCSSENIALAEKITNELKHATAVHVRRLDKKRLDDSEKKWCEKRSVPIQCWDFELLERIHLSPSELVHSMSTRKVSSRIPCSILILPFDFNSPDQSVESIEMIERLGGEMLQLSKACYFTSVMQQVTSNCDGANPRKWSSSEMLRVLDLSSSEFGDIQSQMAEMAATHVEVFRHDPMAVAIKMVQEKLKRVLAVFEDSSVFLYLVDEFNCCPVPDSEPIRVLGEWRTKLLTSGILFMHLTALYARGVSKGLDGFAKLLYQTDVATVPASWKSAASGLVHELNESAFYNEIKLLQDALCEMFSSQHRIGDDDLDALRDFLADVDPKRDWGGLQMVRAAEARIWTTEEGVRELKEMCTTTSFKDALRQRRALEEELDQYRCR